MSIIALMAYGGRFGRIGTVALGVAATLIACLASGCGGSSDDKASDDRTDRLVDVRTLTYRSAVDGSRVTGLAAIPRAAPSRGCVIWQFGFRSTKEESHWAWQGLAELGLTTFSIDFRAHGARATGPDEYKQVLASPSKFASVVRESIGDLRSAVDYLAKQRYCAGNIAYGGVSLGGAMGTILAATDKRVKAVALVVTPGSWRQVVTTSASGMLPGVPRDSAEFTAALRSYAPLDPDRFVGRIAPRPVLILSGLSDETVAISNARALQDAARAPKTILDFRGGHNPAIGPDAENIFNAITSFLLHNIVEPTYGIHGNENGTFLVQ